MDSNSYSKNSIPKNLNDNIRKNLFCHDIQKTCSAIWSFSFKFKALSGWAIALKYCPELFYLFILSIVTISIEACM